MMNGYQDVTEEYAKNARIDFARVKYGCTFFIDKLFKDPDGRIFVPVHGDPPRAFHRALRAEDLNLFPVLISTRNGDPFWDADACLDAHASTRMVVAEFSTFQEAKELLKTAEDMGHRVDNDTDHDREFWRWFQHNQDAEFISQKYVAFPRTQLSALDKRDSTLLMVELIKVFGGILIPEMHQHSANLFPVFAATDKLELVAEFWDRSEAEKFLANAQAEGWRVMQGHHIFAGLKWLASFEPATARVAFPWIEREFPHWSSTKLQAAA